MKSPHQIMPLKTIGLLGGMSSQATAAYYHLINKGIQQALGGHHAAELVLCSVNFQNIEAFVHNEQWEEAALYLVQKAQQIERAGADFLLLATNTMHRVAPHITAAIHIPFVHIVDVTAEAICQAGLSRIGLLGTRSTMEAAFYRERFAHRYGIELLVPDEKDRQRIDENIFGELTHGIFRGESRQFYLEVMDQLAERGAQGIILGCTEFELLIPPESYPRLPLFDTTLLHVQRAVELSLGRVELPRVS